mmetsp:Transcript_2947/g.10338  ORF Transcript_2947/g.10338 Transcript_2947/m.10338 type:complete len:551 (-) Transcript_2947:69-1721(-)|eukprot:CAMPEP_0114626328 /NCGR_PEP_ID=MMETSP0168-20121206/11724_1 /TAXON_ID=95228 ORGANISM="Vannella sp., Strain DIVA3 517/6/12" /NCGR_SAMPLE_ID=MMETSP0168 /ASSEMBLY_ACC=CAM_ASM_000044 /LENGTH=550 /DNA_ID=CAMNT_0001837627 /DNA_START=28 /DNA_END=1680 /DNA_ORIENTATION=-
MSNVLEMIFEDQASGSIPGSGTPWKVLGALTVVQFLVSVVYNAAGNFGMFMHVAYSADNDTNPGDAKAAVPFEYLREVLIAFLVGMAFALLSFGILSDRYGRRKVILVGLMAAMAATFSFCVLLWPALAIFQANERWGVLVLCFLALGLGVSNGLPSVILASGLDVSNVFSQGIAAILIVAFGQGPAARFGGGLVDFIVGAFIHTDLLFLLILVGFMFVLILGAAFALAWRFIPETLDAPVPESTVESNLSAALQDDAAAVMQTQDGSGPTFLLAPPIKLISETQTWICFWTMSVFMSLLMVANGVTGSFLATYLEDLEGSDEGGAIIPVMFISYIILAVVLSIVLIVALVKAPAIIIEIGYTRIFLVCACVMIGVQAGELLMTLILWVLPQETWIFWIGGFFFFGMIMASIAAMFVGWVALLLMLTNNGFRNEGGFLCALALVAASLGWIPIMGVFFWLYQGFREWTALGATPIMLLATLGSFVLVCAGAFWLFKFYSDLNYPRTKAHEAAPVPFRFAWIGVTMAIFGFLALAWFIQTILVFFVYTVEV